MSIPWNWSGAYLMRHTASRTKRILTVRWAVGPEHYGADSKAMRSASRLTPQKRIRIGKDEFGDQPPPEDHRKHNILILYNGNSALVRETGPPGSDDGVRSAAVGGKRLGEPDEKVYCRLQIEVNVQELVLEPKMVTTELKMIAEELTEVTVKLNGERSDVATGSFTRSATLYDLTTKQIHHGKSRQCQISL
ncbi:hypothetical protein QTP88_008311 [Uroleucon formosanum]